MKKAVFALALALPLASCSLTPDYILVNGTGQDVQAGVWTHSIFQHRRTVRAGETSAPIPANDRQSFRAGDCTYSYPDINFHDLPVDRTGRPTGGGTTVYKLQLEPDFSLRFFPMKHDGTVQPELTGPGFPALPQVECRAG